MKIKHARVHRIEEQPGDGTRYGHMIHLTPDYVVIYRDKLIDGEGVKQPLQLMRGSLEALRKIAANCTIREYALLFSNGTATPYIPIGLDENPWTLASAVRCALRAIEEEVDEVR